MTEAKTTSSGKSGDLEFDCCVIGAGLSGLCAATRVLNGSATRTVAVLEAQGRVGGRTLTTEVRGLRAPETTFHFESRRQR